MARRKVTMLEAFQRSAQESAERLAAERRRVVADREKEIRRAETAKAAQEISARLSQRAGDGVGSLIASLRGAAANRDPELELDPAEESPEEAAEEPAEASAAPSEPATDISVSQPVAGEAAPQRDGPALPAFDSASRDDIAPVEPSHGRPAPKGPSSEPDPGASAAPELEAEAVTETAQSSETGLDPEAAEDELHPYEDATSEEVEEAMAALQGDVFEVPMTARAFAWLSAAVLVAVFMIGFRFGRRGGPPVEPRGPAVAALPGTADRGLDLPGVAAGGAAALAPGRPSGTDPATGPPVAQARAPQGSSVAPAPAVEVIPGPKAPTGPILTAADRAFRDPAMAFTIMAITYTRTEAHAAMAQETYDLLDQEGFPVIHPIEKDNRIYLFVGAAGTMGELEELKTDLQGLRSGRSRTPEFRSAFLVNIDSYR